jgi:hypothetical protein
MPESKFDDMISRARRAGAMSRDPGTTPRDTREAVAMLAKIVEELATMLKEEERSQQEAERRLRDADTEPPPPA